MVAFKRLMSATLLKRRLWHRCFSCDFCQICKNAFFTEQIWATASILRGGRRIKQTEISIISKPTKKIIKKKRNALTFFIFYLLCSSFFFSGFSYIHTFLMFKHAEFGKHTLIIRQKLKKHAHFKISSRDEVFTRLFFFFSSGDEISSMSFISG